MEIPFFCMIGVSEMKKEFSFSHHRTHCSFWEHWYADGTFKVCPEIFFQLYTMHGQRDRRTFPCVFPLLPNKNKTSYSRLFKQLFQLANNLGNGRYDVLVDFERSAINVFQNRNIEVQGCFYHLSANIWKHIQHLGFSQ